MKKEKKYLIPQAEIVIFHLEDIIADSIGGGDDMSLPPYNPHDEDDPELL